MKRIFFFVALAVLVGAVLDAQLIRKRVPASSFETVTIAYTANLRGLYTEDQTEAPASSLQSMVTGLRAEYKDMLLVDLGNFIGPAPSSILSDGRFDFAVLERLGYNLVHVSSDDFDIGTENLRDRIGETTVPVVSGNLTLKGNLALTSIVLTTGNRKVGFIGVTSPKFPQLVLANMRSDVVVDSAEAYITQAIKDMEGKADIIVALTDLNEHEIDRIREIPGLDLILTTGGNSVKPGSDWISVGFPGARRAAIARVLSTGTAIYVLDLHGHPAGNKWAIDEVVGDVYPVSKDTPRDPATELWVKGQLATILKANNKTLGNLGIPLANEDGKNQQTALGKAVTDLMRSQTKAQLALLDSGALRKSLPAGPVTEWDLIEAIPYPDPVVVVQLTGKQINDLIDKSKLKLGEDGYLQFSNLMTEPEVLGNRIESQKIIPERTYSVAIPEFLHQGGDGYDELQKATVVKRSGLTLADLCRQAFAKYGSMAPYSLPMDVETNFWYSKLHLTASGDGFVADPDTFHYYPDQVTLVGQQLITSAFDVRWDLFRTDSFSELANFAEVQYGIWWAEKWVATQTVDNLLVGSQYTVFVSNLLFGGDRIADPYVSGLLETAFLYPDPTGVMFDLTPGAPRPGTLKLGTGLSAPTLLRPLALKFGFQWEFHPYDATIKPSVGWDAVVALKTDLVQDMLSIDTSTEVFNSLDTPSLGMTVTSSSAINFSLRNNLSIGPRIQYFYNSLIGHWSYLFDVPLSLDLTFQ